MLKIFLSTIMLFVGECINVKPSFNQAAINYFRLNNKELDRTGYRMLPA